MIRQVRPEDANALCDIYNHYVLHSIVTFEKVALTGDEMTSRIRKITQGFPWIVFEEENEILGYAYATRWKERIAYDRTVESTVYLRQDSFGKGIGKKLYKDLMRRLADAGYHVVLGGIALPNEASISLHESLGFRKVGQLEQVGFKLGRWIDVGYWELVL